MLGDVVGSIPGSDWVLETASDAADSIGRFAKTDLGFHVLSTISSGALYGALLPVVGPFVVMLTTATPGLVAGEDFTTAYTKGLLDSLAKLSFVLTLPVGLGAALGLGAAGAAGGAGAMTALKTYQRDIETTINRPELQELIDRAAAEARARGITLKDALALIGATPDALSKRFGVRQDVIAHATNARAHQMVYDPANFDARSGAEYPPLGAIPPPFDIAAVPTNLSVAEYDDLFARARADGRTPQAVLDALSSMRTIAVARTLAGQDPYKIWRSLVEASRNNPGDRAIAEAADAARVAYERIAPPGRRLRDMKADVADQKRERDLAARRQPPPPASDIARRDAAIADVERHVAAIEPPPYPRTLLGTLATGGLLLAPAIAALWLLRRR